MKTNKIGFNERKNRLALLLQINEKLKAYSEYGEPLIGIHRVKGQVNRIVKHNEFNRVS